MCSGALHGRHRYTAPPAGETRFDWPAYDRELLRCAVCGHVVSRTAMDLSGLYDGAYMDATYAGEELARNYARIMALPEERSDNVARVRRLVAALGPSGTVLDVGSGLGVFPARMRGAGWTVTALDPDARAAAHLEGLGIAAVQADFLTAEAERLGRHDLVTFNKVLEHVADPVAMLARARDVLRPGGAAYVELPDADGAAADPDGPGREEFFVEHLHVFTLASLCLLARHAGLAVTRAESLREPSGKYTLWAFLAAPGPSISSPRWSVAS
jgi:SAM-dependent methyltransferase